MGRLVIWAPPGDVHMIARDTGHPVLWAGITAGEVLDVLQAFADKPDGVLIVSSLVRLTGWHTAQALAVFLDGCPEDAAWRAQARGRSERVRRA